MMLKTILVPVDLGPLSDAAVERAVGLARPLGSSLVLLYVEKARAKQPLLPPGVFGLPVTAQPPVPPSEDFEKRLDELGSRYNTPGVPMRALVETSTESVADAIVRVAQEQRADMVVMGTHGRNGVTRVVLGSVAEAVVREASQPILLIPAGAGIEEKPGADWRQQELGVRT